LWYEITEQKLFKTECNIIFYRICYGFTKFNNNNIEVVEMALRSLKERIEWWENRNTPELWKSIDKEDNDD